MHAGYWSCCLYNKINVTETCVTYDNHHNNKTPPKSHPETVVIILQRPNRWPMKQPKRWWSSTRTFRSPSWPLMRPLRPTASTSASLGQPLWEHLTVSVVIYSFGTATVGTPDGECCHLFLWGSHCGNTRRWVLSSIPLGQPLLEHPTVSVVIYSFGAAAVGTPDGECCHLFLWGSRCGNTRRWVLSSIPLGQPLLEHPTVSVVIYSFGTATVGTPDGECCHLFLWGSRCGNTRRWVLSSIPLGQPLWEHPTVSVVIYSFGTATVGTPDGECCHLFLWDSHCGNTRRWVLSSIPLGQPLLEHPTVSVVIYSFGKKQTFVRLVAQIQIQISGRVLSVIYLWMFVREVRSSEP